MVNPTNLVGGVLLTATQFARPTRWVTSSSHWLRLTTSNPANNLLSQRAFAWLVVLEPVLGLNEDRLGAVG